MRDDTAVRVSAVTNAVLVLVLALIPLSREGRQVDHEQVRPWGCRTCPIPAPATEGAGGADALGAGTDAVGAAQPESPTLCDGNCPGWVEMLLAACTACPAPGPDAATDGSPLGPSSA